MSMFSVQSLFRVLQWALGTACAALALGAAAVSLCAAVACFVLVLLVTGGAELIVEPVISLSKK